LPYSVKLVSFGHEARLLTSACELILFPTRNIFVKLGRFSPILSMVAILLLESTRVVILSR
jgi:hypothetical protein